LYLAEKYGAEVLAERNVLDVRPLGAEDGSEGYAVSTVSSTKPWRKDPRTFTAKGIVFAGGVLGTVPLLFRCKKAGSLPKLSEALGDFVRTNSEALVGASTRDPNLHLGKGIAITSGVHVDEDTHIEMVRYGDGGDAMSLLANMLVGAHPAVPRWLLLLAEVVKKPFQFLRQSWPFGASRRFNILLVMQHLDNSMKLVMRRRWFSPFKDVLDSDYGDRPKPPTFMPQANDAAAALAQKMGGDPSSGLVEVLLNTSSTAHILGGCSIGRSEKEGVIDADHRVYGYKNMLVCDGSVMPANLGVNPSLTITAMSERAMSKIPPKEGARVREPIVGIVPEPKIPRAADPAPRSRAG
ncbi:MAG: GMC family oxidoreductase, partial [Candidatus Methylomirabilis sp.]|nr:GMC family oxidoreductase [Deltaproteobacteria bacterium]